VANCPTNPTNPSSSQGINIHSVYPTRNSEVGNLSPARPEHEICIVSFGSSVPSPVGLQKPLGLFRE